MNELWQPMYIIKNMKPKMELMEVIDMEQKPLHYDGSFQLEGSTGESVVNEPFQMTDEMRINIGQNPYSLGSND